MNRSPERTVLERVIRAIQGNFDHLNGVIREVMKKHNALDDNVQDLTEFVNDSLRALSEDTAAAVDALPPPFGGAHADLSGVTSDQHHAQGHNHTSGDSSGVLTADEHDSYMEIAEIADPSSPGSNKARLYVKDNGSGKTQLVVLFPSGATQVIITEP